MSATRFPVELPLARCGGQYAGSRGEFQPVGGVGPRVGAARRWPPPASLRWAAVRRWTPPASHGVEAAAPRRVGEFFFLLFPVKCFLQIFSRFHFVSNLSASSFPHVLQNLFHFFLQNPFHKNFAKIRFTKFLQNLFHKVFEILFCKCIFSFKFFTSKTFDRNLFQIF